MLPKNSGPLIIATTDSITFKWDTPDVLLSYSIKLYDFDDSENPRIFEINFTPYTLKNLKPAHKYKIQVIGEPPDASTNSFNYNSKTKWFSTLPLWVSLRGV